MSARCVPASTKARSACWPWISTRAAPSVRSAWTLTGWSLTKARVRPSANCTRRTIISSLVAEIGEEIVVGEHAARRMLLGDVEDGGHLTLFGALAHQRGIAAGAERQGKGIEQDRFAGAGLAGQHRETGPEIDVQPIDQNDIADGKADEHEASDTVAGRKGLARHSGSPRNGSAPE